MEVILTRSKHTEWVDGKPVIFVKGDKLTISEATYKDFPGRFEIVKNDETEVKPDAAPKEEPPKQQRRSSKAKG